MLKKLTPNTLSANKIEILSTRDDATQCIIWARRLNFVRHHPKLQFSSIWGRGVSSYIPSYMQWSTITHKVKGKKSNCRKKWHVFRTLKCGQVAWSNWWAWTVRILSQNLYNGVRIISRAPVTLCLIRKFLTSMGKLNKSSLTWELEFRQRNRSKTTNKMNQVSHKLIQINNWNYKGLGCGSSWRMLRWGRFSSCLRLFTLRSRLIDWTCHYWRCRRTVHLI